MIDDDAQVGNCGAQRLDAVFGIRRAAADDVQGHAAACEIAQIPQLRRVERDGGRAPQKPADADKAVIARESLEVCVEVGGTDFKLTREKREEGGMAYAIAK